MPRETIFIIKNECCAASTMADTNGGSESVIEGG